MLLSIIAFAKLLLEMEEIHRNRILNSILFCLISYNIFNIYRTGNIPVEFSTVSYILVPLIVLLNVKSLEVWTIYASVLSGSLYYFTMIISGGSIYHLYPHFNIYISLFSHGSLLLYGYVKLQTTFLKENDRYKLIIGVCLSLVWAIYIRSEIMTTSRLFIYEILDAKYIYMFFQNGLWFIVPAYYLLVVYMVFWSTKIIFRLNKKIIQSTKKVRRSVFQDHIYE
jgi:hypothetical protein